jgi:ABC-type phosphate transport system auxiliary subunit
LSLLEEQERPQTASVGQQLQAIIERVEELRDFFDKIKSEQQRKAIPKFLHALKLRNKDDKELAGIFDRLDRARLELTLHLRGPGWPDRQLARRLLRGLCFLPRD